MRVNWKFTPQELSRIRALPDFDLMMFLCEIYDHDIPTAMKLLPMIEAAIEHNAGLPANVRSS